MAQWATGQMTAIAIRTISLQCTFKEGLVGWSSLVLPLMRLKTHTEGASVKLALAEDFVYWSARVSKPPEATNSLQGINFRELSQ